MSRCIVDVGGKLGSIERRCVGFIIEFNAAAYNVYASMTAGLDRLDCASTTCHFYFGSLSGCALRVAY